MTQVIKNSMSLDDVDFLGGTTLLIDKPLDWTSFDAVNKIRYTISHKLGIKKIKVGHAGTLDPLATGLLLICTGKSTKIIETLQKGMKEYVGDIKLGATTPTYDAEMEEDEQFAIEHIDEALVVETLKKFTGTIDQKPPIFSALKKNGKALYKYARKGQEVEIPSRKVFIEEIALEKIEMPNIRIKVRCGKGTYIRSLAYDLGKALNSGGYLTGLRRTRIGEHSVQDAWPIDHFVKTLQDSKRTLLNDLIP